MYKSALKAWSQGNQRQAEKLLYDGVRQYPDHLRLNLFFAACARSRFATKEAFVLFLRLVHKAKDAGVIETSVEGKTALCMVSLDQKKDPDVAFTMLQDIVRKNPKDPLPLWLLAISYRTYERPAEGVAAFRKLIKMVGVGGVTVHQSCANLLDDLGRYEESLKERQIAVKQEPSWWSYHGLATTLYELERFAESAAAGKRGTELAPNEPRGWNNWGMALISLGKPKEAAEKLARAIAVAEATENFWPNYGIAYQNLGSLLEDNNQLPEALEKYLKAIEIDPKDPEPLKFAADVLDKMGRADEAKEFRARAGVLEKP